MTSSSGPNLFSAVDSTLGYLYQVRLALLWSLRRLRGGNDFSVSVESLDDVTFVDTNGSASELLQTKHHRKGTASLTNASPDLWKTLRIWFEGHQPGQIPSTSNLCLITTGVAPDGSAAALLRSTSRDVAAARQALDATASSSTNQSNSKAYSAYLNATTSVRTNILDRVVVIDSSPSVTELDDELKQEVYWAADKTNHSSFLERLEGWWLRRVLQQLTTSNWNVIGSVEIESRMSDLREQFKLEALPIDDDLLDFALDEATEAAHENSAFVRQLELIKAGKRRIAAAIRDYYRAFEQRSRWLRDDLVIGMDLHKYEKRLSEEWELIFEAMRDNLGDAAAESAKETAARSVLEWAERSTIAIRPNVTEPFLCRGSLHMLSDELRIGWHPEFRERLSSILSSTEHT